MTTFSRILTAAFLMSTTACAVEKEQDTGAMAGTVTDLDFAPDSVFGVFDTHETASGEAGIWQVFAEEDGTPEGNVRVQIIMLEENGGPTEPGTYELGDLPSNGFLLGLATGCREVDLGEEPCEQQFMSIPTGSVTFTALGLSKGESLTGTLNDITFVELDVDRMSERTPEELENMDQDDWILDREDGGQEFILDTWSFDVVLG